MNKKKVSPESLDQPLPYGGGFEPRGLARWPATASPGRFRLGPVQVITAAVLLLLIASGAETQTPANPEMPALCRGLPSVQVLRPVQFLLGHGQLSGLFGEAGVYPHLR